MDIVTLLYCCAIQGARSFSLLRLICLLYHVLSLDEILVTISPFLLGFFCGGSLPYAYLA